MKLEIEGLLRGRDMGYSVRHPDHDYLDEFCCCEERHCHLPPSETPKERHHYASLMIAAPEMLEALQMFLAYNDQGAPLSFDTDAMWAKARSVVAKIEGGEA